MNNTTITVTVSQGPKPVTMPDIVGKTKDEAQQALDDLRLGRHTPFFNNYRPQFYFRTTDVTGVCNLPAGTEMCMPGDNIEMTIELIHPVAMEQGLTFAIREGGRTVGSGRVATIIE